MNVAVLGLGRMGRAIAYRLADTGFPVTGWSRRGRPPRGVRPTPDAGTAVRSADVVVLCGYDGAATADLLSRCAGDLPPGCLVLNTATVAAAEARAAADTVRAGTARYLHCPVIGSTGAAESGALTLLAGDREPPDGAPPVLAALGDVVWCDDTATAATAKLLANAVLADGLVAVGQALARAGRLGLDRDRALAVLGRTVLGGLVTAKRHWLTGGDGPASFTAGALGKDVRLLADADPDSAGLAQAIAAAGAPDDADVGVLAARLGADRGVLDAGSHLYLALPVPADEGPLTPLIGYARGHATGDPGHFRAAFRPTAHIEGIRDGAFVSWDLATYCGNFTGRPADDEPARVRTVTELRRAGTVAHATMVLRHGPDTFTDMFVLVAEDGGWRIANKVYHRAPVR